MSDWSSDVCSSDLQRPFRLRGRALAVVRQLPPGGGRLVDQRLEAAGLPGPFDQGFRTGFFVAVVDEFVGHAEAVEPLARLAAGRSEEHTSELQSLMRTSYAVFCLTQQTQYQQLIISS